MTQMVESSPKYNFNKNNHPGENGRPVTKENTPDGEVDVIYEPDMYHFDYQADGPSRRKQDLTSSLLYVAVTNIRRHNCHNRNMTHIRPHTKRRKIKVRPFISFIFTSTRF